jgi:hypothetical protein
MSDLPDRLLGTGRVSAEGRQGFCEILDGAGTRERGTLLTEGGAWVWDALKDKDRGRNWEVFALVPHVAGYVREATDYGMFGAGWRRLRRMGPLSWLRLGFRGLFNVRGVLRKDFPTLLVLLLELEMANFRRARPRVVFLHPQITDLLLAMDHGKALERAVQRIRRGFGAEPGLATYNAGTLLARLQAWGIELPYLLTSAHPRGYGMRPGRSECEEQFRSYQGHVVAYPETALTEEVAAYWRGQGVAGGVYDVARPRIDDWQGRWASWKRPSPVSREAKVLLEAQLT